MTELVLTISRSLGIETKTDARGNAALSVPVVLGLILIVLQIADGFLTYFGMSFFGTDMEGNALLRSLMHTIGVVPALVVAKTFAIAVIIVLVNLANEVEWLTTAMKCVIALYLFAAVIPWSVILASHIW